MLGFICIHAQFSPWMLPNTSESIESVPHHLFRDGLILQLLFVSVLVCDVKGRQQSMM